MGLLEGRVALITGGGRGLGREHALLFAAEGAKVVVNDLGGSPDGTGADAGPAAETVADIRAMGREAVANGDSVTSWEGAQRMINAAIEAFGDLDIVVNNAGVLRDRVLVNMTEEEFDTVVAVHQKGTFAVSRWAAAYWRDQSKAGVSRPRHVVNTSSGAGLHANPGQTNYAGAKAAIAAMTGVMAKELARYGVTVNCIAPVARTRLTLATPGIGEVMKPPEDAAVFDVWDPANISPLVAYLASTACRFNGQVFSVNGDEVGLYQSWHIAETRSAGGHRWELPDLVQALSSLPTEIPVKGQF